MKKYKSFNVECIKLIIDDNEDFNESDYELVVGSIEKRNGNMEKGKEAGDVYRIRRRYDFRFSWYGSCDVYGRISDKLLCHES